jgi:hypothetical protein
MCKEKRQYKLHYGFHLLGSYICDAVFLSVESIQFHILRKNITRYFDLKAYNNIFRIILRYVLFRMLILIFSLQAKMLLPSIKIRTV